jgi:hypothetical protein
LDALHGGRHREEKEKRLDYRLKGRLFLPRIPNTVLRNGRVWQFATRGKVGRREGRMTRIERDAGLRSLLALHRDTSNYGLLLVARPVTRVAKGRVDGGDGFEERGVNGLAATVVTRESERGNKRS